MGAFYSLRGTINLAKSSLRAKLSKSLSDIDFKLPDFLQITKTQEDLPFLSYDNGYNRPKKGF